MSDSVYKVIEVIGTSSKSWEAAAAAAVERASQSLRAQDVADGSGVSRERRGVIAARLACLRGVQLPPRWLQRRSGRRRWETRAGRDYR